MWSTAVQWAVTGGMCGSGKRMGSPSVLVVIKNQVKDNKNFYCRNEMNIFNQFLLIKMDKIIIYNIVTMLCKRVTHSHMSFTPNVVLN